MPTYCVYTRLIGPSAPAPSFMPEKGLCAPHIEILPRRGYRDSDGWPLEQKQVFQTGYTPIPSAVFFLNPG